jgi:hypothetical protein
LVEQNAKLEQFIFNVLFLSGERDCVMIMNGFLKETCRRIRNDGSPI